MKSLAFVCVMVVASTAGAQVAPPGATPETAAAGAPDEQGVKADANQDHAWYLPTGETVPKGAVVFTDWELLLAGLKYGAADGVELSAETLVPITTDIPLFIFVGGKLRVLKTDNVRVAVNANLLYAAE